MKKIYKRIISLILIISTFVCASLTVFAAEESEELYLSDLRIVYADDYDQAREILDETEFAEYNLLNSNLNENTGKTGVYLAFKITTDIEDAITDIAVMQMNGGYNEGNYQEMIKQSYNEYLEFGENYLVAIEYFNNAYDAGNYLAEIAHRQLNFYNVVTEGIDDEPEFEGERLGDIFFDNIDVADLATIFMEGNSYALNNIRSLLAMGVSYNEDGKTYLEKVESEAERYNADKGIYDVESFDELAVMIAPTITTFCTMFKELSVYESELNYDDDVDTDLEIKYMEYMVMALMMRDVTYQDGKTLYDFCLNYTLDQSDYSSLYPLVAALNEGQVAMTKVAHYYDVVRYSMTLEDTEEIETELAAMEEEYGEYPFNVYEGVDRTIYRDTYALTSAAYRADAYTESGLSAALYGEEDYQFNIAATALGSVGVAVFGAGLARYGYLKWGAKKATELVKKAEDYALDSFKATQKYLGRIGGEASSWTPAQAMSKFEKILTSNGYNIDPGFSDMAFKDQMNYLSKFYGRNSNATGAVDFQRMNSTVKEYITNEKGVLNAKANARAATKSLNNGMDLVYTLYIVGGLMMLGSAIALGIEIYNYYHPTYDDIPTAMVDLIDTVDGDRYIKYDVVFEAEENEDGGYSAADLNAFSAARWNALYYTKSYEAGKPLLADEFIVSNSNNIPGTKYAPIHRFGEVVCYNLNKYNFDDDHTIYLSVKQSDNEKYATAGVPELVGSMFSAGYYVLAGVIGAGLGVGATVGTQEILKRRKNNTAPITEAKEESAE